MKMKYILKNANLINSVHYLNEMSNILYVPTSHLF